MAFISVGLFLGVWQIIASVASGASNVPSPLDVFRAARATDADEFWSDLRWSSARVFPGLALGAIAGICVGIIGGRTPALRMTVAPVLHGWRALPAVALAPIFVQILGINEPAKIIVIALGTFFPVWVATQDGAASLNPELLDLARTLDLKRGAVYRKIVLPWTLPFSAAGVRIGIGSGYAMLFFSEWLGASHGVGYRIALANTTGRLDRMIFSLAELGLMAYLTDLIFDVAVKTFAPWVRHARV